MGNKAPLSVVIIAKDEEARIKACLESVKWADEIIVVDDYSKDRTTEIARQYTDSVFQRKMDVEGRHRNWAYALARNRWVLSLDADERATPQLKEEILDILTGPHYEGYSIPRRNYIGNYWVRYGGWYPSAQGKLFEKSKFRYEEVGVHPRAFLKGAWGQLNKDILHYSYAGWEDFLNKSNAQTSFEAAKWYNLSLKDPKKAAYKMNLIHALWRTMDRFIRTFFVKRGWRDGFVGFMVAFFASFYQLISYGKYWELRNDSGQLKKYG